jgi:hypothetical protein
VAAIDDIEAKDIYVAPLTSYKHIHDIIGWTKQYIATVVMDTCVY